MDEYVDTLTPAWFFGLGLTKITVYHDRKGNCYPFPSGKVSSEIADACKRVSGTRKSFTELVSMMKEQLSKEYLK